MPYIRNSDVSKALQASDCSKKDSDLIVLSTDSNLSMYSSVFWEKDNFLIWFASIIWDRDQFILLAQSKNIIEQKKNQL